MTDAVVLSSFSGQTDGPALRETLERLAQIKVKVLGNVLSSVKNTHSYYKYGYQYYGQQGRKKHKDAQKESTQPLLTESEVDSDSDSEYIEEPQPANS